MRSMFVHRNEPNRPHISSDISNFKERGTEVPKGKSLPERLNT